VSPVSPPPAAGGLGPAAPEQLGPSAWGAPRGQPDAWPTAAQELLLSAALLPDERALEAWRALRPQLRVAEVDGAAQVVLPTLHRNLKRLGAEDELMSLFKGVHRFGWARGQILLHRMLPVVGELEAAGIPTMLLKGAALVSSQRLDAGLRPMNDVDVLVPTARAPAAIEVLLGAGLAPVGGVPPWYVAEYAPRFVPSHGFDDGRERQLDLHWHVLHWSCQPDADEDFWAAATPTERLGVRTRTLCASDELLLVILHGLRWNAIPTYRWVLDASLLASGLAGPVDFDRLVAQAVKRRAVAPVRAGLRLLVRVADAPVPDEALRRLHSHRAGWIERAELRALMRQPRRRTAVQRMVIEHQQFARRRLALGPRPKARQRIRLARESLGIERARDLGAALSGGRPGPGRPLCEEAAAVGAGPPRAVPPVSFGQHVRLGAEEARRYVAHGVWLPEPQGCWIAGREARLVLGLRRTPDTALALSIAAEGYLNRRRRRQRLTVIANGSAVGARTLWEAGPALLGLRLPREVVEGRTTLDLVLRAPDAASPAELGLDDDQRRMGVFLRGVMVCQPPAVALGTHLRLGQGVDDESMLAGGWGEPEPFGRWSQGPLAQLLVRIDHPPRTLEIECETVPFIGQDGRHLRADLLANDHHLASLDYAHERPTVQRWPLPASTLRPGGELLLTWRVHNPASPAALGISADRRPLGLFLRRVSIAPAGCPDPGPAPVGASGRERP